MTDLAGEINLSGLEGLAISSHWSARYAGLHQPSERDLAYVRAQPQVERIVSRAEWIATFPGAAHDPARIPDYLALAREGWTFRTTGTSVRQVFRIPAASRLIPVATPLGTVERTHGGARPDRRPPGSHADRAHHPRRRGAQRLRDPARPVRQQRGLVLLRAGRRPTPHLDDRYPSGVCLPGGYRYADETDANPDYPYSGYFKRIPEHTLGRDFSGPSIAVGNHSMLTHMIFGTDIAIECFARNLYNQGCLGVIHR